MIIATKQEAQRMRDNGEIYDKKMKCFSWFYFSLQPLIALRH